LPARFDYSAEKLMLLCVSLRTGFRNGIEFRDASWWRDDVFETLHQHNITFCNASYPGLPDMMISTTPVFYMRLHGDERLFYSNYESERLRRLYEDLIASDDIETAFVYFNNTAGIHGIQNALTFQAFNTR
jgi:uncharacterized protein YecE (DUF72 family)